MRDRFTFEMSFYFSGMDEEWLPHGTTDYQFYIEYVEPHFLKMLSVHGSPIFNKRDLRRWVKKNTSSEINYVRDYCECVGTFNYHPNIEKLAVLGNVYNDNFNPISQTEILHETTGFFDEKLGYKVCLFVNLRTLGINDVAA